MNSKNIFVFQVLLPAVEREKQKMKEEKNKEKRTESRNEKRIITNSLLMPTISQYTAY